MISSKYFIFIVALMIFVNQGLLLAQKKEISKEIPIQQKKEQSHNIDLSGKIYFNWHTAYTQDAYNQNTFEIQRLYLTWKEKFNDIFSAKVTTDISKTEKNCDVVLDFDDDGIIDHTISDNRTQKYELNVKYAYLQTELKHVENIHDKLKANVTIGMIATPIIGFIDKQSDARWIHKNSIDDSKKIVGSNVFHGNIDHSADLGLSVQFEAMKKVTLIGAITNGEGYKDVDEGDDNNKAYYGRLTITPITHLYLSGFYKREGTDAGRPEDFYRGFYGGCVSWMDDIIKAGILYIIPFVYEDGSVMEYDDGDKAEMYIMDIWLNINVKSIIDTPLFLYGRYTLGEDKGIDESRVYYWGTGIGYEFNRHVRFIAYYDSKKEESEDDPENTIWLKSEIKI
ncbi:MAG: hypothetical protein SVZ03_14385 [Spirochaetota bacterium]|nr:hypothetical protein [Spirochaetota bacterium]